MRYVTIFLVTLVSSCSWSWPWGTSSTGNCLDDGNCEGANPFEEKLKGGTWHCYGVSKKEPWDCSQERDETKIMAIEDSPEPFMDSPELALMDSPELALENSPELALMDSPELALENSPEPALMDSPEPELSAEMSLNENTSSAAAVSSMKEAGMEISTPAETPTDLLSKYSNNSYAIQLIALRTLDEVSEYADGLNLNPPMYVKIRSQGSDWYVVLLGIYETRAEADAASEEWASNHDPSARPWVRPIHPLKKAANLVSP
jgi:cell division septation protein DedD